MLLRETRLSSIYQKIKKEEYSLIYVEVKQLEKLALLLGMDMIHDFLYGILKKIDEDVVDNEYCCLSERHIILLLRNTVSTILIERIHQIDDYLSAFSFSFGIYYPTHLDTYEQALLCARLAGTQSDDYPKHTTSYEFYNATLHQTMQHELHLIQMIEQAIERKELQLYVQPKVNLVNDRVCGAEALIRWFHNEKMVPLSEFMPLINENHFIRTIDIYVFHQILIFLSYCLKKQLPLFPISINISKPSYLDQLYYLKEIDRLQAKYTDVVQYIQFELSEHITDDKEQLYNFLLELKKRGYQLSLDDFGSGSSSLPALTYLPYDCIKMDQSFFQTSLNERNKLLIRNIVTTLKQLQFHIVAEGIEQKEWIPFLKEYNCDEVQGYFYYRPMPLKKYVSIIKGMPDKY